MIVGILAVQGDVPEHRAAVDRLGRPFESRLVRRPEALADLDALLMPGGESTTMARLLREDGLWGPLDDRLRAGLPVLATCAGLILLAREVEAGEGPPPPPTFGRLDVVVRRNDYGRQRESFEAPVAVEGLGGSAFPGVFIRAPRILRRGPGAATLARRGSEVVGVRDGAAWGLSFHPELSGDDRLLRAFLLGAATRPGRGRSPSA